MLRFLVTELVPQNSRSAAYSIVQLVGSICGFVAGSMFLPLEGAIGPYSFLFYIAPLAVITVILYFHLPETKNRPITQIMAQLAGIYKANSSENLLNSDSGGMLYI